MRRVPRFVVPVVVVALTALSSLMGATTARAGGANPSYVDFSQCANGALPSTSTACPGGFLAGGTLSNANSHYSEDNVVPQRAVVTLSSGSALTGHSFTFSYEARKGVIHTYDSLATWNVTQQTADPCQGLATGTCPAGSPSRRW